MMKGTDPRFVIVAGPGACPIPGFAEPAGDRPAKPPGSGGRERPPVHRATQAPDSGTGVAPENSPENGPVTAHGTVTETTPAIGSAAGAKIDAAIAAKALVGLPLAEIERVVIEATVRVCDGALPKAARMLGVSPSTLYRKYAVWAARSSGN